MNFTPNELQNVLFRRSLIGFHQNQVYEVLQRVVEDYATYIRENTRLKEKLDEAHERLNYYKGIETSLQNSLLVAQQSSEEVVSNARQQAENIVSEAKVRAMEIMDGANRQIASTLHEKERLERELEAFRIRVESLLQAQIALMKGYKEDEPERVPPQSRLSVVGK